ncbi:MAG TPA: PHP domain-containing protein [Firmicutes bacterium]|nr:PHP domain-containing protein [Bacillota bacterium]
MRLSLVADLHIHTTASDGTYTPEEIVSLARREGITTIAITDHDSVDNVLSTMRVGAEQGVQVVSGIELSTEMDLAELHLLGYGFSVDDPLLTDQLGYLRVARLERIAKTVDLLAELGIHLDLEEVLALAGDGSPGRAHVARLLVDKGYTSTIAEGFDRFLGHGQRAYVPRDRCHTIDAIRLIRRAGGVPVLAHPGLSAPGLSCLPELVKAGLMGLEVFYPQHSPEQKARFLELAAQYGLLVTGGSDCHGGGKDQRYFGSVRLPDHCVQCLLAAVPTHTT